MQEKKVSQKNISDCFTPELTNQFKNEMDVALKKIDMTPVKAVLDKYQIAHFQDSIDFVEALSPYITGWQKENEGSRLYSDVTTSESRCIACEYGKDMIVYEFEFIHSLAPEPMNRVVYGRDFGILFDIRDEILFEVRVCNAFLNKQEMIKLNFNE
ncbi:hypothetical protein JQC67_03395 [Aurantibacter crassamenti]|uniref:hypothetical protein n=1 Tax=Aurantibacter crassamenti TaxID=1837375 RepID=UPI001939E866|nr:hypothetical protein [Aurantibacter crassamenti]MBM1105178.1 hypothetical protein [Aurantibacter crassamenti]